MGRGIMALTILMCEFGSHQTPNTWEIFMNRTVVSGIAAFALLIGAAVVMSETAEAGHHGGGLFSRLHAKQCGGGCAQPSCGGCAVEKSCGGGLFARLKAKHATPCCVAEPVCCEPAPAPVCCEPAPAPVCCEPAPAPVCCPEPTCSASIAIARAAVDVQQSQLAAKQLL